MPRYTGLPDALREEVLTRDSFRCRWCGATNQGGDLHHIEYRRGFSYDVADNLITLCRMHHSFVHGIPVPTGQTITKAEAQLVLRELVERPGLTGSALWRTLQRQRQLHGDHPPLRPVPGWDGESVTYRCDVCGCGVARSHVPGSADCDESALERRRSRSD